MPIFVVVASPYKTSETFIRKESMSKTLCEIPTEPKISSRRSH